MQAEVRAVTAAQVVQAAAVAQAHLQAARAVPRQRAAPAAKAQQRTMATDWALVQRATRAMPVPLVPAVQRAAPVRQVIPALREHKDLELWDWPEQAALKAPRAQGLRKIMAVPSAQAVRAAAQADHGN